LDVFLTAVSCFFGMRKAQRDWVASRHVSAISVVFIVNIISFDHLLLPEPMHRQAGSVPWKLAIFLKTPWLTALGEIPIFAGVIAL
jgi:hypothetical protein